MTFISKLRERRDHLAAVGAISMAREDGKRVGIGVDDLIRVDWMASRVKRLCEAASIAFTSEPVAGGELIKLEPQGQIYVFAADKLTGDGVGS